MIVLKYWNKWQRGGNGYTRWKGYFLFGLIPLYIEQIINAEKR